MIGVPTATVSPSGTIRACTVPANGEGSSTSDLAVSISTTTSLTLMTSPTLTFQVTISASVSPSPTSGSLYSGTKTLLWSAELSVGQRPVDCVEHPVEVGEPLVLDPARGVRRVETTHPQHRRLQRVEALLADPGGDLRAHAEIDVRLMDDDGAAGLAHRLHDRTHVEWRQRAQVDNLDAASLRGSRLGGGHAGLHHRPVGQQRDIGAFPHHTRGEQRIDVGHRHGLVELLLVGVVLPLRLEEDHRVVAGDGLLDHPVAVDGVGAGDD